MSLIINNHKVETKYNSYKSVSKIGFSSNNTQNVLNKINQMRDETVAKTLEHWAQTIDFDTGLDEGFVTNNYIRCKTEDFCLLLKELSNKLKKEIGYNAKPIKLNYGNENLVSYFRKNPSELNSILEQNKKEPILLLYKENDFEKIQPNDCSGYHGRDQCNLDIYSVLKREAPFLYEKLKNKNIILIHHIPSENPLSDKAFGQACGSNFTDTLIEIQ